MSEAYEILCDSSDREAWLAARRKGVGSSDAPALFGLTPWASPTSVFADKLGLLEEPDEAEVLKWGRRLEPAILQGLSEESGVELRPFGKLLRSKRWPFLLSTPDGADAGGLTVFAQVKNTIKADEWTEEVPKRVWVQNQHEMAVTGHPRCLTGALLLGNRFVWAWVERDTEFIEQQLVPACEDFWRHVEEKEPLEPDASEATKRALQALYPEDTGESVPLPGRYLDLDVERTELIEQKKATEMRLAEIDADFRAAIKEATYGVLPSGVTYSLKTSQRKGYSVKATTYRALRRLKGKTA